MFRVVPALLSLLFFLSSSTWASETMKGARKDIDNFKTEMSAKLDDVEKKLTELRAKAKEKGSAAKEEVVTDLEKTRDQLKTQLAKADDSAKENWKKFKESFAKSVDNLNSKIQKTFKD